jgi:hypothetical protein
MRDPNPLERFNKETGRRTVVVGISHASRDRRRRMGLLCAERRPFRQAESSHRTSPHRASGQRMPAESSTAWASDAGG